MLQRTIVLIKPDAVKMGNVEAIIKRYTDAGLDIVQQKEMVFSKEQAEMFYSAHKGQCYFVGLVFSVTTHPLVALELEGDDAIRKVRDMNGNRDLEKAAVGTIRKDFKSAGGPFNSVHGTEKMADFQSELIAAFHFPFE